ncbi:MAG: NAD(P)H-hydrate dehydratase [Candidatus Bathyarchaeia archaeon]
MAGGETVYEGLSAREMAAIEQNAEYLGVSMGQLMECAGRAVAEVISSRLKPESRCTIYAGTGRNGGDGMVAARHLASRGFKVTVILVGCEERITDPNVRRNWETIRRMTATVETLIAKDSTMLPTQVQTDIVVDALLGTGARGNITPPILQAVISINNTRAFRVAVDIPTGIDASTGDVLGEAVKANLTVTFHKPKRGLLKAVEGYVGDLVTVDIGIPKEAEIYAGPGDVYLVRRPRPHLAHKGDFGRLLVIGGSETYVGAPAITGLAALQTGVDLVYVAAPREVAYAISTISPDLITVKLSDNHLTEDGLAVVAPFIEKATAVAIGPGLGLHPDTTQAVESLLRRIEVSNKPLVLDADGLKVLGWMRERPKFTAAVLTPHAGEYKILTGEEPLPQLEARSRQVRKSAEMLGAVVLLKGPVDVISDGRRVKLNFTGNPGMTVGGTGDVLTGVVGGFLAQGVDVFEAAVAGAFVNGAAGDLLYRKKGYHILPTDLIEEIPYVIEHPMEHIAVKQDR